MASKTSILSSALILLVLIMVGVFSFAGIPETIKSVVNGTPGMEHGCTVQTITPEAKSTQHYIVTTDGCGDTETAQKTFSLTFDEEMKKNFVEMGFQKGIPSGTVLNVHYKGLTAPSLDMIPEVVRFSESPLNMMPY